MDEEFNEYMEVESDENGGVLLALGKELSEEGHILFQMVMKHGALMLLKVKQLSVI